jgi:hypothetical protein
MSALVIVAFYLFHYLSVLNHPYNYLHNTYHYFDIHKYGKDKSEEKYVLLGSSAASGNNIPANTTIVDYINLHGNRAFYNFGLMEARVMDSVAILKMIEDTPPKAVVYGINMGNFIASTGRLGTKYIELIKDFLPPSEVERARKENLKKFNFLESQEMARMSVPGPLTIQTNTLFDQLKRAIFGSTYNKNFYALKGKSSFDPTQTKFLLEIMIDYVEKIQKAKIYFYFEPIVFQNDEDRDINQRFFSFVKNILDQRRIKYLDLSQLFEKKSEYFIDFIHLQPKGNEIVAKKIIRELLP